MWYISGDNRLSIDVRDAETYLSVVSVWESIVKYQLNKLLLPGSPEKYLPRQRKLHQIFSLALDESSIFHLAKLPPLHRAPFDRMLICQAIQHGLTIATVSMAIRAYSIYEAIHCHLGLNSFILEEEITLHNFIYSFLYGLHY